ncbi:MAG: HAMP domain-containing histidine kinase [Myxococcales bacterium]|nr:HAMP domain-containing histidine kinase [Myxococcales bacterium]
MPEGSQTRRTQAMQNRILFWTMLLAVIPIISLFLLLSEMLNSTRLLTAKDAGDYAERKTQLLNLALQNDLEMTLHTNAASLAAGWQNLYQDSQGDLDRTLQRFMRLLDNTPGIVLLFNEEGNLTASSSPDFLAYNGREIDVVNRQLQHGYVTATAPLPPVGYTLLYAQPREKSQVWQSAAQRFQDDFTTDVRAKFDSAIAELRFIALAFFLALCLIAILMSRWLARNLTHPLEQLTTDMETFDGRQPIQLAAARMDEIGILSEKFSEMTFKLVQARGELEEKQGALEKADQEIMQLNLNLEKRISERTADLEIALEKLRELDKNKDDFLSLVSHELKTPLTSISASAEALLTKNLPLTERGRERFLRIMQSEALRLTRLINDLLDLSSLEAGRIQFHFQKTDLIALVQQTCEAYRLSIIQKGLAFEINLKNDPRLRAVVVDADRVVQVVTNLLSNAIKFTEKGRITVRLDLVESGLESMARLVVADTGIGIQAEDAHKVFDRFQQIERLDTHHDGLGLGMPISRMIVEWLGGDIHFASRIDHGTAFTVVLPLDAKAAQRKRMLAIPGDRVD